MTGARVRLLPVLLVSLGALGTLKASGLAVSLSAAAAQSEAATDESPPAEPARSPAAERLFEQIKAREQTLLEREADLDTREQVLAAAEKRLDAAMKALSAEKQAIALAGDSRIKLRDDELSALSSAYERMKARDAARIFEILDDDILLPVAAGMRTQALAGVLAEMSAERARHLTVALANRERPAPAAAATP